MHTPSQKRNWMRRFSSDKLKVQLRWDVRQFIFWDVRGKNWACLHLCKPLATALINLFTQSFPDETLNARKRSPYCEVYDDAWITIYKDANATAKWCLILPDKVFGAFHYFFTIKFIRLRKPMVKSLGLASGFDFLEVGFELGSLQKPYWNSLSNSSHSSGVISETFFPENEFLNVRIFPTVI